VAVQTVTALTANEKDTAVEGLNSGVGIAMSGFDRLENGAHVMVRKAGAQQARQPAADTDTVAKTTNSSIAP